MTQADIIENKEEKKSSFADTAMKVGTAAFITAAAASCCYSLYKNSKESYEAAASAACDLIDLI